MSPTAGELPSVLYAYTPQRIKTILGMRTTGPAQRRLLLGGLVLGASEAEHRDPQQSFETWLVERWLREAHSEAFRESAEYEYLRAEWEKNG